MPTRTTTDAEVQPLDGLHLYHAQLSNSSMRVRLLLAEKGLAWTSHLLDATRQDNLTDSYLRINPTSLIPALVHNGVVVTESSDILYYLEEHFPNPRLAPAEEGEWAEMRERGDRRRSPAQPRDPRSDGGRAEGRILARREQLRAGGHRVVSQRAAARPARLSHRRVSGGPSMARGRPVPPNRPQRDR
jgi:glutathione S-transferase